MKGSKSANEMAPNGYFTFRFADDRASAVGWVEGTRETHHMPRDGPVGLTGKFDPPYNAVRYISG